MKNSVIDWDMISESNLRKLIAAACALPLALLLTAPASAQSTTPGNKASPWAHKCIQQKKPKRQLCHIIQRRIDPKSKQTVLAIIIGIDAKKKTRLMRVVLPFGLYLPAGIELSVDGGKPRKLPIETCQKTGCFSGTAMDSVLAKAMKSGKQMTVKFQSVTRHPIQVPVNLKGFTAAYTKLK